MTQLLRFATAGSVDDGKSTLVGRLLHDSKAILADQFEQVQRTSRERGFGGDAGGFDFALLTDGLRAEREQGITIDVAYRYFSTGMKSFILADCPGHVQYTRNMVTGATTADVVVVLVDVRNGVLEQTRRHLSVTALLRVPNVIIAVNKIDLVGYDQAAFDKVVAEVEAVTDELGVLNVHVVPVSALEGDNIVDRSTNTPWYDGPALLELLESLPGLDEIESDLEAFRLDVQLVLRPQGALATSVIESSPTAVDDFRDYRAFAGQISSGIVKVGDKVDIFPAGVTTTVIGIDTADGPLEDAHAPQSVALRLADDVDAARGSVIAAGGTLHLPKSDIEAEIFQLDPTPLAAGTRVLVKFGTRTVQAIVREILGRRNLDTLAIEPAERLDVNDIGHVHLKLAAELPFEDYSAHRRGGAFIVIHPQTGQTLAAGIHTLH
ncbi:MAG TPA: GTP-binding protein [Candidatus Lumbricidophila sp.]|nr:GTP-binding protein [Candidatus Lumbricidophila sp.]